MANFLKFNQLRFFYSSGKSQSGASQYHAMLKSLLNELAERKVEIEKLTERVDHLEVSII